MKETNYWQQFMSTGCIEDYLNYRKECMDEAGGKEACFSSQDLGENSYAGVCDSYRNDFTDGACR